MNRRQALKLMTAAGAGVFAAGYAIPALSSDSTGLFMISGDVRRDLDLLREAAGLGSLDGYRVAVTDIAPAMQDLTVLRREGARRPLLHDPRRSATVDEPLQALAAQLRGRRAPGSTLITIEPVEDRAGDIITVEVNGRLIEEIDPSRAYRHIDIDGLQGRTTLRLQDGQMRVLETSCRHKTCMALDPSRTGRIICAPNRLVVHLPHSSRPIQGITG